MDSCATGMSAPGNIKSRGTQAPWSKPRFSVVAGMPAAESRFAARAPKTGSPGAGYWRSCKACGNPRKSWMVCGRSATLATGCSVSQCAETIKIDFGRGIRVANAGKPADGRAGSMGSVGAPWETKSEGRRFMASGREGGVGGDESSLSLFLHWQRREMETHCLFIVVNEKSR